MRAVVSGLVAFCVATVVAVMAAFAAGGLGVSTAWVSLAVGLISGGAAWFSIGDVFPKSQSPKNWVEWSVVTVFTLFALRAFCWLIYWKDADIAFLSPNNLGDLSLHLTYIHYLANGAPFWPVNPIYSAASLHYPFGVDLFNSLLTLAGINILHSLVWVGLLGSLATGVMLWRWGGAFAIAGFLFNGGVAGFAILQGHPLEDFQDHFAWKSIPLALFITQRGLLYAIPAGLALLWSWRARLLKQERGLPVWIEVILYATMPLFHLHTFIFLSAMLAWWLCMPTSTRAIRLQITYINGAALVPATVLVWFLTGGLQGGHMIHWKAGWMQDGQNPLAFWFENFGLLPLCVIWLIGWILQRRREPATFTDANVHSALVAPALLLFLVTCFVMFAPWEWDNTKLMIWCYLAILPSLWAMLCTYPKWLRSVVCTLLFFSGFISLIGGLDATHDGFPLSNREELDLLEPSLRTFPITATFVCQPTYNHPLLLLGRKVVEGYDGHLMSHGIDYKDRRTDLISLMNGEPGWQKRARELGVDYLYWGNREATEYADSKTPWKDVLPVVAQGDWGAIYDLRNLPKAESAPQ